MSIGIDLAERGLLPDSAILFGIRRLLRARLAALRGPNPMAERRRYDALVQELRRTPLAIATDEANAQHYEVPTEFFRLVLGRRMKYSSALYGPGVRTLDQAEEAMLATSCRRAQLKDGQDILELGCGWGSLTLWMAEHYPNSRITAVSNSRTQRAYILGQCRERGLDNVEIITCDVNDLTLQRQFDRIVSVEMFEHVRNYEQLFARLAQWLRPDGKIFVHIFVHGAMPYTFETEGDDNWMGKYFFTGGIMPSDDLFYHFQGALTVKRHWRVNGRHYERTALDWLRRQDQNKDAIMEIFRRAYGPAEAGRWFHRWRIFFLACAGLWGYDEGREWWVSHYLFEHAPVTAAATPSPADRQPESRESSPRR